MLRTLLTALALALFALPARADDLKTVATPQQVLDEVNAQRAQRGLRPFLLDEKLTQGALQCAIWRARNRVEGHTPNDFGFLPPGVFSPVAGCAAWPVGMGFGACELYGNHRYCGAAYCIGPDGKRYMHAFYRD